MVSKYESVVVFTNKYHSGSEYDEIAEKYKEFLLSLGVQELECRQMGTRKLAYSIRGYSKGYYMVFDFKIDTMNNLSRNAIEELERHFKIDDDVLKFITVREE